MFLQLFEIFYTVCGMIDQECYSKCEYVNVSEHKLANILHTKNIVELEQIMYASNNF